MSESFATQFCEYIVYSNLLELAIDADLYGILSWTTSSHNWLWVVCESEQVYDLYVKIVLNWKF